MTEKLLQYIWQFQYFNRTSLETSTAETLQIIHPGQANTNQGPDFLNARIRIGDTFLAGSIELHIKTSDWDKHRHQFDKNYSNVILHVVYQHDINSSGLPVLELAPRVSNILLGRYERLMHGSDLIPCGKGISQVKEITLAAWKERLLAERLTRKAAAIVDLLHHSNHHWEEVCWWLIARHFGSQVNQDAFESIARSIPLSLLAKHKHQIHQLEALLFGQAGLLDQDFTEAYPKLLQREYQFLQHKYQLQKAVIPVQFLRMRPGNFPTIRLAQLAMLIHTISHLFSKILEATSLDELKALFKLCANDYWHYHYRFDEPSEYKIKNLGTDMIDHIIINAVCPLLFAYGLFHSQESFKIKSLSWLEETLAESNRITKKFKQLSLEISSAFDSQAFIELNNSYCTPKRCLQCSIGVSLLKQE
jgi:hypothetical protein